MSSDTQQAPESVPAEERIRQRAYELYVERGQISGYDVEDWIQAEQEFSERQGDLLESKAAAG